METIRLLLPLLFYSHFITAQFGPVTYLDTVDQKLIAQVESADMNLDGLPDIVVANQQWPYDHLTLYTQQSDGSFSPLLIPVADSMMEFGHFAIADLLDQDKTEIVASYGVPGKIELYSYDAGEFIAHTIDDSLDITTQLIPADFNHDGVTDLLSLQHVEIVLYIASSPGVFNEGRIIHSGTEFYAIDTGYYDQDDFLDVAVASDGFDILINDGDGFFTIIESSHIGLTFRLQSADLDGDKDFDIAAYVPLSGVLWYSNDGTGHFQFANSIFLSPDLFDSFRLEDLDCDGDADMYTAVSQFNEVIWSENNGWGFFQFSHPLHIEPGELIRAVSVADINGDKTPDVLWGFTTLAMRMSECIAVTADAPKSLPMQLAVYPNPSYGDVILENNSNVVMRVWITDILGQVILKDKRLVAHEHQTYYIAHPGIYYVTMLDDSGNAATECLLIQHKF